MASPRKKPTARTADRYQLYLDSVQDPEHEVKILNRVFKDAYKRPPLTLREDFCGTAAVCAQWVSSNPERRAWGLDIDPEPLAWGRKHHVAELTPKQKQRITLLQQDVRTLTEPAVDVAAAQNFSFWIFKTRPELKAYFECVLHSLEDEGVFLLDMMGGPLCQEDGRLEKRRIRGGFSYQWDQEFFDPITHNIRYHINFAFQDGTMIKRAFTYDWRLWSLPEVRELLLEAGFARTEVYWLETDPSTGTGSDVYRRRKHAPADPAWLAYVVGIR